LVFDLLDAETYLQLHARPASLEERIPKGHADWIVLDEVQRVPEVLNEVHRLIEARGHRFALTGSSARKLRRRGVNLLAGRALTYAMHPLTARELGRDFDLGRALRYGCLPFACTTDRPAQYLASYATTYLREEVQQEGLTRNLSGFSRFLEVASFSQGSVLNRAGVARDCALNVKTVEDYFDILEDLLIAVRLPVFTRRAKRRLTAHPKFYYFDTGVFRALRPRGPLDSAEEIEGPALETLFLQQARALNDGLELGYTLHYWRTSGGHEVDFVLYGERGLLAFEVKRSARVRSQDLDSLRLFLQDFPEAKAWLLHLGRERRHEAGIEILPFVEGLEALANTGTRSSKS
jgi:predicted AAA+ superfamily ATPase